MKKTRRETSRDETRVSISSKATRRSKCQWSYGGEVDKCYSQWPHNQRNLEIAGRSSVHRSVGADTVFKLRSKISFKTNAIRTETAQ